VTLLANRVPKHVRK